MCGIAGLTTFHSTPATAAQLQAMGDVIRHRGPDAGEIYSDNSVGLCHRRLAIIDLSAAGVQPMKSSDERYVIVFNGEIYNYQQHRQKLAEEGYQFRTQTDTEVILALYAKHGVDCLHYLDGMFAFALWDKVQQQLFIARDRIGKKPLYYRYAKQDIAFASELKSLMVLDGFEKKIRVDAVYDFFAYQYVPDPKTIFEGVYKLEPGHYLVLNAQGMTKQCYWDVSFQPAQPAISELQARKELTDLIKHCTSQRMISDVPLGAFLSGGVDSSGIVALMSTIAKEQGAEAVTTCTIGFDDKQFNEAEFAKIVADKYLTNHVEFTVHQNVVDNLVKIAEFFDEPFADPSLVPTYFVSELARQKVTVALAGDGGDEIFAGYEKYAADHFENRLRAKCPRWLRKGLFPVLAKCAGALPWRPFQRARSLLTTLSVEPAYGFYISNSFIRDEEWRALVRPEIQQVLAAYHPSQLTLAAYEKADGADHLSKILYTDLKTFLPGGILVKVDRMSMAHSLEVRAPLLDFQVIEYAAKLTSDLKLHEHNGQLEKKYLLKELFKPWLPEDILYRKKMGFSVPLADWLRTELKEFAEQRLITKPDGLTSFFKQDEIERLWREHQAKRKDHSSLLWSMLMFELWWDRYMAHDVA